MTTADTLSKAMNNSKRVPAPVVAKPEVHKAAPALGWYTDNILFGEVWSRTSELPKRDRSLIVIAALITGGQTAQMVSHFNRALQNGIRPTEIAEVIAHLAFYAGWPCAMSAVPVMQQVFATCGVSLDQIVQGTSDDMPVPSHVTQQPGGPFAPALAEFTQRVLVDDLWTRKELTPRDRSFVTIVSILAQGQLAPLSEQVARGLDNGLTEKDLSEAVTQLAFYLGWPRITSALPVIEAVLNDRKKPA